MATKKPEVAPASDTMLYRSPGVHDVCEFRNMGYMICDESEVPAFEAEGWHRVPGDAQAAYDAAQAAPATPTDDGLAAMSRTDLAAYAVTLGLTVKDGWNDAELLKQVRKASAAK